MRIYIDFDDCLCETAKAFTVIAKRLFDISLPYENIKYFDLKKSFGLTDEQYEKMMLEGHLPEELLAFEETPKASETVNGWIDSGHEVYIITGRPYSAYEPSRQWLDEHNLSRAKLYCLNKYGRDSFIKNSTFSLELEEFYKMKFDFAVEDSPAAFKHLTHLPNLKVNVFNRPWNQDCEFPNGNYMRKNSWDSINQELMKFKEESEKREYMKLAVEQAREGIHNGHGGPFGSVIVKDGKIVGRGHNMVLKNNDSTAHGEVTAIRNAERDLETYDLSGAEIYTTGEPCPMCLAACMWANISKVYYGCTIDDNEAIGFRDAKFDHLLGGRKKMAGYLEEVGRDMCLELFDEYNHIKNKKLY